MRYDPLGRLHEVVGANTTRFLHDGSDLVAEYDGTGALLRRYVHGLGGGDDPLVWFEGSGVADGARRYLYADERGSIVAVSDGAGAVLQVNSYDDYGIPDSGGNDIATKGRFRYTGQIWVPELGMYYYKARMYSPTLGRFMQTDPIGYGDGMNIYAYVKNDPVNGVDPTGLACGHFDGAGEANEWTCEITGRRLSPIATPGVKSFNIAPEFGFGTPVGPMGGAPPACAQWSYRLYCSGSFQALAVKETAPQNVSKVIYNGCTFGNGPTVGGPNRFYPNGRTNSGRPGDFNTALGELDSIANLNGVFPLGEVNGLLGMAAQLLATPGPLPVGHGWVGTYNSKSNYTSFPHASGLAFRFNPATDEIRVEIPEGFQIPGGGTYSGAGPEVCHYPRM